MNREIKFRAWDIIINRMVNVWGINYADFDNQQIVSSFAVNPVTNGEYILKKNDSVLMQYTGIKDKAGREIYEGDIVKIGVDICVGTPWEETFSLHGYHQGEVIIHRRYGVCIKDYFTIDNVSGSIRSRGKYKTIPSYRAEVIGNIYEHAGLLTPKTENDGQTND